MNAVTPALRAPALRPLHPLLGAELEAPGPEGALPHADLAQLRRALDRHSVIVARGARMSPAAQIAFTARLGALEQHPLAGLSLPDQRGIVVEEPGTDDRDLHWHADLAWCAAPSRYSALSPAGVEAGTWVTEFASLTAAYDRLEPWLKDRIEFLEVEHDHPRRLAAGLPAVVHPLVRVDPASGRRFLMLDFGTARRVLGVTPAEGAELLHRLLAAATHPSIILRHEWRNGDLVVWDNLAVLHRSRYLAPGRLLRTMVRGGPPLGPRQIAIPWVSAG